MKKAFYLFCFLTVFFGLTVHSNSNDKLKKNNEYVFLHKVPKDLQSSSGTFYRETMYPKEEKVFNKIVKKAEEHCSKYNKKFYLFKKDRVFGENLFGIDLHYRFICAKNVAEIFKSTSSNYNIRKESNFTAFQDSRGNLHESTFWLGLLASNDTEQYKEFIYQAKLKEENEKKVKAEKVRKAKIEKEKKARKIKLASLENKYSQACSEGFFQKGFTKGTQEYEDCLFKKEKEAIAKQKAIDVKLAKMTPVQRREYNCEETFQFRKGSDKFKDCVFKLYTTELELQKLELQKQVAEAKLEAEKAKAKAAATEKDRADAVARAQIAAAQAQKAAAKSQSLATSMSLIQLGSSMMSSPAPAPSNTGRVRTTCRNVGGFLNCY